MAFAKKFVGIASGLGLVAGLMSPMAQAQAEQLDWADCAPEEFAVDSAQCATFDAPKDYAQPNGEKITLKVSKIPATGDKRGVIAGNPGGPGGPAVGMFADSDDDADRVKLPTNVREHYDLIAVEPRGLGTVECEAGTVAQQTIPHFSAGLYRELCNLENPGYLDSITTANTARDLDLARQKLGEDKLSLYGVSYGGYLMGTYATMFPEHTDRSLIDSSIGAKSFMFKTGADRESWRRDSLHEFFQWVADRNDEYGLGTTPIQVYKRWSKVIEKETGVPAQVAPPTNDKRAIQKWRIDSAIATMLKMSPEATMNSPLFLATYFEALYNPKQRPVVAEYIKTGETPEEFSGLDGEWTDEQLEKIVGKELSSAAVERAIMCNDNATKTRPELVPKLLFDRVTGGDMISNIENGIGSGEVCAGWPLPKPGPALTGDKLQTKPLHVGFENDSAVTGDAIWETQNALGGQAIQVPGHAHGVMIANPEAVADQVSDYFLRG